MTETGSKPNVVFVLGGPGAGKGTQCSNIVNKFGWVHLSAGDLLREERNSGSENGELISNYIKEGKIVPVVITVNLLKKAIQQHVAEHNKYFFLVDGFPRNQENLDGWSQVMGSLVTVQGVLFFDCPETVMEARLLERGKTSGRSDDNAASIKLRFKTFQTESMAVIKYYQSLGLVHHLIADKTPDEVWVKVQSVIVDMFKNGDQSSASGNKSAVATPKSAFNKFMRAAILRYWQTQQQGVVAAPVVVATPAAAADPAVVAAAVAAEKKAKQFWDIEGGDRNQLILAAVKATLFNPVEATGTATDNSVVKWTTKGDWSMGGTTVTAAETKTVAGAATSGTHIAYINSYGVLEHFSTPSIPESVGTEPDSCNVM
jgi:UMP-CMP kinase